MPLLGPSPGHPLLTADGREFIGPPKGGAVRPGAAAELDGVAGTTTATTCAFTVSPAGPGRPDPTARRPPATGSAGPASGPAVGRG